MTLIYLATVRARRSQWATQARVVFEATAIGYGSHGSTATSATSVTGRTGSRGAASRRTGPGRLHASGRVPDAAVTLRNVAVCQISAPAIRGGIATYAGGSRLVSAARAHPAGGRSRLQHRVSATTCAASTSGARSVRRGAGARRCAGSTTPITPRCVISTKPSSTSSSTSCRQAPRSPRGGRRQFEALDMRTRSRRRARRWPSPAAATTCRVTGRAFDRACAVFRRRRRTGIWPAQIDLFEGRWCWKAPPPPRRGTAPLGPAAVRHFAAEPTARTAACDVLLARLALPRATSRWRRGGRCPLGQDRRPASSRRSSPSAHVTPGRWPEAPRRPCGAARRVLSGGPLRVEDVCAAISTTTSSRCLLRRQDARSSTA